MKSPFVHGTALQARLNTCRACPFYNGRTFQCEVSGHLVPVVARVAYQSCPEGRW